MTVKAISNVGVLIAKEGRWQIRVETYDDDGRVVTDVTPTVVITPPSGSNATSTMEAIGTGAYRAVYVPALAGRYVATVTAAELGRADFTAYAVGVTPNADLPSVEDVKAYVKTKTSWADPEIQRALDAESSAQRARCRIGAAIPPDLREALMRRVACNLARRAVTMGGNQTGDAEVPAPLPTYDPEIRRLEAPYRKVLLG